MTTGHGRLERTPISPADPAVLLSPAVRPRSLARPDLDRSALTREELLVLAADLLDEKHSGLQAYLQELAVTRTLNWLGQWPGDSWQDRWLLSGSDARGQAWGPAGLSPQHRGHLTRGLRILIVLRVVQPSYAWLSGSRLQGVYAVFRQHNQPATFARLAERAGRRAGAAEHEQEALNALTRIAIVTGKDLLTGLDGQDVAEYAQARRNCRRKLSALPFAYELLRSVGGLAGEPPTLRHTQLQGQLTPAQLVDRYQVTDRAVRDVLVHYLTERAAVLDHSSLVEQSQLLVSLFWVDLERHHPGINSLGLPAEVAQQWKQRLRTLPNGQPRAYTHGVLLAVRGFYLDLLQWSLADPASWARWARWAAPCPITAADIRGYQKQTRRTQARMQARTRTLLPVLPQLVAAAEQQLQQSTELLALTRSVQPGGQFEHAGTCWRRVAKAKGADPHRLLVQPADSVGPRRDAGVAESNAFWTWAIIEMLRRTGVRVEELLELTHLSVRQYQAPTGESVPLLQISPSKTDRERVIPADPDLVAVLARIIRRVRPDQGRVPLLSRYDTHERTFGPVLPHLFQRVSQHRLQVLSPQRVRELLKALAQRAELVDVDGTPLRFTPHDFRRIFSTETVNSGLPIHIAAKLLGHLDLNTTQGYVAVYPEEVIRHYRQFVHTRRTDRPAEEYREPSDTEWQDFRDHFALRKVALGTCDRPYGTPCQHEHACVRCPMLRMDLAQVPRLLDIERNTHERLTEARGHQWLGEVSALQESLRHIASKKQQAERLQEHADRQEVNAPSLM